MVLSSLRQFLGLEATPKPEAIISAAKSAEIVKIENETRDRFVGSFIGLAVGDAKGMPAESKTVEYADYVADRHDYIRGYLPAGHFTDDTHQATILAESLIDKGTFDPDNFMQNMSKMDLSRGYGPTTIQAIVNYLTQGVNAKTGIDSPDDGPSMRIAPMALMYHQDPILLRHFVERQARLTHDNDLAVAGSMTVAFSVAYMINHFHEPFNKDQYLKELIACIGPINQELAGALHADAPLPPRERCHVMEAVPHAIRTFTENPYDFEKAITKAIRGAGDADTIAAMVGAISGAFNGKTKIPKQWIENLENTEKGRDYIIKLANQLYELSKAQKAAK
jgi:ADP-ribosyl-[dinitrogen reductase] hydrolase